jgi:hypothetical protein
MSSAIECNCSKCEKRKHAKLRRVARKKIKLKFYTTLLCLYRHTGITLPKEQRVYLFDVIKTHQETVILNPLLAKTKYIDNCTGVLNGRAIERVLPQHFFLIRQMDIEIPEYCARKEAERKQTLAAERIVLRKKLHAKLEQLKR